MTHASPSGTHHVLDLLLMSIFVVHLPFHSVLYQAKPSYLYVRIWQHLVFYSKCFLDSVFCLDSGHKDAQLNL